MRRLALASLSSLALGLVACGSSTVSEIPDASMPDAYTPPPPMVSTSLGAVVGARGNGYQAYLGIPYAEPPVGELRWRAPVASGPWEGELEATRAPTACAQEAFGFGELGAEDCLYLNVHTPDPLPEDAPVLVWIHGGAFVFGEGLQLDRGTAGDRLAAEHGVVVVSMNYRLGGFGFLPSDELGSTGNEGFQDQQLALRWVRDHIASFGGDPANVTIAGESAGGVSVCLHLLSPGSEGLFARAITQSGLCDGALPERSEQLSIAQGAIEALGCADASDVAACMRGKTLTEIRESTRLAGELLDFLAEGGARPWPSVDGTVIPGQFRDRLDAGEVADVPLLIGWNLDEGTLFVGLAEQAGTVVDEAQYHATMASLASRYGVDVAAVESAYPLSAYADPGAAVAAAIGHASLACPSRRAARALAGRGADVFVYRFEYAEAGFQLALPRELGAFHSAEIQFVFGHPSRLGTRAFMGDELALHESMMAYWARFATSGDPNGGGAVTWPRFGAESEDALILDTTIRAASGPDRDTCALWDPPT